MATNLAVERLYSPPVTIHEDRTLSYQDLDAARAYAQDFRSHKPYRSIDQLLAHESEGLDFTRNYVDRSSSIVIVAPHGGNLELGTSQIAERVAASEFSVYSFNSLKPADNESLHITSSLFNCSLCESLIAKSQHVLTVHGCRGSFDAVFVGGANRESAQELSRRFREGALIPSIVDPIYLGRSPQNICNRGKSGFGIQLEITAALRDRLVGDDGEVQRRFDSTVRNFLRELSSGSPR